MESAGEEKLKALFSELKAADEDTTPRFATVWNRGQVRPRGIRAFNPAFVAATALLVFVSVSLAVWSKYSQRTQPQRIQAVAPAPFKTDSGPATVATSSPVPKVVQTVKQRANRELLAKKLTTRHDEQLLAANRRLTKDAKTIASWQSPTTALLSSPGAEIFNSLPQLNRSASDLKSFLPARSN